jgi:hypothetical protein
VNFELGYAFREGKNDEWVYGIALGREVSEHVEILWEIHGTAERHSGKDELVCNAGVRWDLSPTQTLLFSAGRSLRDSASGEPEFLGYLGLQFNFEGKVW